MTERRTNVSALIGQSFGEPPYHYNRGEELTVAFRTDRSVLKQLLPPVLEPLGSKGMAVLRVMRHAQSTFGPYIGVYLGAPALLNGDPVFHLLTGMKTDFRGTAAGREVWGMPLQTGEVTIKADSGVINVAAGRNGIEFARMSMRLEHRIEAPSRGVTMGTFATRRQVFEKESTEHVLVGLKGDTDLTQTIHWKATATVHLVGGEPGDDWSILPVGEVLQARYNTGGFDSLDYGAVVAEW
jgi:hypothetical protein